MAPLASWMTLVHTSWDTYVSSGLRTGGVATRLEKGGKTEGGVNAGELGDIHHTQSFLAEPCLLIELCQRIHTLSLQVSHLGSAGREMETGKTSFPVNRCTSFTHSAYPDKYLLKSVTRVIFCRNEGSMLMSYLFSLACSLIVLL